MKRTSLLRKIALASTSVAAICPVVLCATACAPTSMMVDIYDFKSIVNYESGDFHTHYSNLSFKTMLYGNKKFHNGNYILVSGAASYDNVALFFASDTGVRSREDWFSEGYFSSSILYASVIAADANHDLSEQNKNIGFYNAIDFFNRVVKDNKGNRIYIFDKTGMKENIKPFEKWTADEISETKRRNSNGERPDGKKYDWDDESVEADKDYIRNDEYAKAFRAFSILGARLFPTSEEGGRKVTFYTDGTAKGQLAFYKNGVLKAIEDIPTEAPEGKTIADVVADLIVQNYKDEEEPETIK